MECVCLKPERQSRGGLVRCETENQNQNTQNTHSHMDCFLSVCVCKGQKVTNTDPTLR